MDRSVFYSEDLTPLSYRESICVRGGGEDGWDYQLAEYVGMGVGYGVKKLWKAFKFLSKNIYEMRSNPMLLYQ